MDLLQELENNNRPKPLSTHQLSWATVTATKEAWWKIKALELSKVTNWLVKFITQSRKKEVIPRLISMLIIIVLSLETTFLSQILIKRITKLKNMKKERIQSSKWLKVDLKFLVKLDNDQRWQDRKCWKILMRRKIRCRNLLKLPMLLDVLQMKRLAAQRNQMFLK